MKRLVIFVVVMFIVAVGICHGEPQVEIRVSGSSISKNFPLPTSQGYDSTEADTFHIGTGARVQFATTTIYVIDFVIFNNSGASNTATLTAQSGSETKVQFLGGVDGTGATPWISPVKCLTNGSVTCPAGLRVYIKYRP